ncbi:MULTISPECIES: chemotaxis protein CheA [unclassified Lentimicrobium]|uniref:chemotaxis protein CheA n=1 Tax=unclassified Lentimicrobium TaxID=2677434 RepID=UPI00155293CC|nr:MULTISPECIES: chemotaxis protein CheA [unclassified Lentimicrobium]NPD45676.1 chemotaxis protein CheA [Lentimicrobium sp. S6]NPD85555.1 chemotaxis protein CheA [Lentimicrobium sp. L6]
MDELIQGFLDEANELIVNIEDSLFNLEKQPDDQEAIASVFRVMHTLKGSGAMFGFSSVSSFTHHLESIYEQIRSHKIKLSKEILNLTFESIDLIKKLLETTEAPTASVKLEYDRLITEFEIICNNHPAQEAPIKALEKIEIDQTPTYYICFEPNEGIMQNGTNPLYLIDELISLGNGKVFTHIENIPNYRNLLVKNCYVSWEIILNTKDELSDILDVFIFVEDESKIEIQKISDINLLRHLEFVEQLPKYIGSSEGSAILELQEFASQLEISQANNTASNAKHIAPIIEESLELKLEEDKKEEITNLAKDIDQKNEQVKIEEPKTAETVVNLTTTTETSTKSKGSSSIRVSSDKVETLINLVSEMVTIQARLSLLSKEAQNPEIIEVAETLEKLTRQLRDNAFEISLIPISSLVTRFQRLIRDLSKELNKEIEFIAEGTDTELDKTIIESLADPLMHIFRNAIDHGIESTEDRLKSGKTAKGTLKFKAYYSGTSVYIDIIDDGQGINTEKVKAKALSQGLINEKQNLSTKQINELILLPGFSTADNVTDISGRGVGMDVVKKNINKIQGEIEINSVLGQGTTFSLKLPLTLSIIDGLLVRIDKIEYIIPILVIKKVSPMRHQNVSSAFNNTIIIDGEQLPFLNLREEFNIQTKAPDLVEVVVVNYGSRQVGIIIDRVIRESQVVVKSIGKHFKDQEIISGASIMGDGSVALVLDTNKIIDKYSR